jgi:hypothetical protein
MHKDAAFLPVFIFKKCHLVYTIEKEIITATLSFFITEETALLRIRFSLIQ